MMSILILNISKAQTTEVLESDKIVFKLRIDNKLIMLIL